MITISHRNEDTGSMNFSYYETTTVKSPVNTYLVIFIHGHNNVTEVKSYKTYSGAHKYAIKRCLELAHYENYNLDKRVISDNLNNKSVYHGVSFSVTIKKLN